MSLAVAIQMDPIERIDIDADSTFVLALEAQGAVEVLDLRPCNIVVMREDPPFDLNYVATTHLLERLRPDTLVINDPVAVRNAPEKLFVTHFAELMPPTLITYRREEIKAFRAEHKDIILKPLYGNAGAGVFH